MTVTLSATCDVSGTQPEPSDQPGTRRFDSPPILGARFTGLRIYTFPGGCASYRFSFAPGASRSSRPRSTARWPSCPGPGW